uniref:uncharacterized protein LOC101292992 n=1 Tax=Fragaria vesca subsp. vesca TaxID=101020 RepID=UPI0005C838F7|nr:PREDICTED: uncharacterized protein LOC101292992 [Fragaria vesca subsp. vesca]
MVVYKDSGDSTFECNHCGAYFWIGEALVKSVRTNNNAPVYTGCCQKGEIRISSSNSTPPFLQQLLDPNNGRQSVLFRENIRVYNSMFSFTSMGAKIDSDINRRSGPYVFKICGQIHHLMGSALPAEGERPKYAQLYVYDTNNEVSNRMEAIDPCHTNKKTKPDIVQGLIQMFDEINELVKEYRYVRDKYENGSLPSLNMTILGRQQNDSRQYELPTNDEVAGLIVGDIGEFNSNRDIIIQSNDGNLKRIFKFHPKYMSLQYPLLFPYGEDGYRHDLTLQPTASELGRQNMKLTMIKFVCYQIHDRQNDSSTLLKGGRLFQQYLVDAYATVEEDRLDFVRTHQGNVRSDIRKNIFVAASSGVTQTRDMGKQIILPSTHTGSPRDMINNYQDTIAICRQYGNPDLFITFTCNVKWPEITRYLNNKQGYRPEDRPDIILRIFKLKLDDMLAYIKFGQPFGEVEANVCTIEFQKRGLPHAHMLFWLKKIVQVLYISRY